MPSEPRVAFDQERGIAHFLLTRSPLGLLARWVAEVRASVHTKLLFAFLFITLLIIITGMLSLYAVFTMDRQSRLLNQAHEQVNWSRQLQHSLAMQMNFTAVAMLQKQEAAIQKILRENNRFNSIIARIEETAPSDEHAVIQRIHTIQDETMTMVADIADKIRDGKLNEAMTLELGKGYSLYLQIGELVDQIVKTETDKMENHRRSLDAFNHRALIFMSSLIMASILLALLLGFVISWSFLLPIQQAHRFLSHVTEGDFSTTITVPNRDELGALADHMNRMSRELDRLYKHQAQAARDLQVVNRKLELASQAKSEFLANMSHELRTPMNAILGFVEMILDKIYGNFPPKLEEPLTDIQTNGKHLIRLINDVLDLSKIEAGRMELSLDEYSVQDVVDSVRAALHSLAQQKGLGFIATVQEGIPLAYGDAKRITQCLINLAGNALKFTKEGQVEIRVEQEGETLNYSVTDTGIGISPDKVQTIFEGFQQGDATITRDFGGTGLGLSIAKTLIEMHGGRIWVESKSGKGSTFFFSIPLRVHVGEAA